jgi:hypothetical protein
MTSLNVAAQLVVPEWVKARALASYQLVVQGGMALGGLLWGVAAARSTVPIALGFAAASLAIGLAAGLRYRLAESEAFASEPLRLLPLPVSASEIDADVGPVMVAVEYEIDPVKAPAFRLAMNALRTIRYRDGAVFWGLFTDMAKPERHIEYFMVESWSEHLRQHGRGTDEDRPVFERARSFHVRPDPPVVSHQIAAVSAKKPRTP